MTLYARAESRAVPNVVFLVSRRPLPDPEHSKEASLMARLAAYLGRKGAA